MGDRSHEHRSIETARMPIKARAFSYPNQKVALLPLVIDPWMLYHPSLVDGLTSLTSSS